MVYSGTCFQSIHQHDIVSTISQLSDAKCPCYLGHRSHQLAQRTLLIWDPKVKAKLVSFNFILMSMVSQLSDAQCNCDMGHMSHQLAQ
jgi:hypothetical protein